MKKMVGNGEIGDTGLSRATPSSLRVFVSPHLRVFFFILHPSSFILALTPQPLHPFTQATTTVTLLNDLLNRLISFTYQTKTGY
jgi:hypothetical protein